MPMPMDSRTSIAQLRKLVKTFCEARDWDQFHGPKDLAIGVITEAAELLEHFRFKSDSQMCELLTDRRTRKEIEDELADILFFILRFSQRFNIDLSRALKTKLKANAAKYPVTRARGKNLKYTEL